MFQSVLIANRGEIACRIARTARRMGLRTIAVHSEPDAQALHVQACDEAYAIGPAAAAQSYLDAPRIIAVARRAGAQCIHPGYGFLSENAEFAEACASAGIAFIGPPPDAIRAMGLKDRAKTLMEKAGVATVPGYHGERQDPTFLKQKAYEIGYPVLIKAVAGGGGKGMRPVDKHAEFEAALESARREAMSAFGSDRVLIEKWISAPRHIEFQIFADTQGNAIHLNERDCSLQRRHQKVMEEAPAPGMDAATRATLGAAAVRAAKAVGYVGAGTVEFIADGARGLRADACWFMEMNTRLQVEHPVTEAITGQDLVEWQFRVAAGDPLPLAQDQVRIDGHAIEARIYAENPASGFLPSVGRLAALRWPQQPAIRIDTGVEEGGEITPHYDPMIAKMIAHGATRADALEQMASALETTIVAGPYTNIGLLAAVCRSEGFRAGGVDTAYLATRHDQLVPQGFDPAAVAAGIEQLLASERADVVQRRTGRAASPWDAVDGFQLGCERHVTWRLDVDGRPATADVKFLPSGPQITVDGQAPARDAIPIAAGASVHVIRRGWQTIVTRNDGSAGSADAAETSGAIRAPMHGKLVQVLVAPGERVVQGQRLGTIEAMKMEHALVAPFDGVVGEMSVAEGLQVAQGALLLTVQPDAEGSA